MKKLLLSVFALASSISVNAQCNELFISEYTEGANNNKSIEIFNPSLLPIALNNNYRLVRYNNGTGAAAGESNATASVNLGTHVMQPGEAWVITIDKRNATEPCPGQECAVATGLQAVSDTFLCPDYNVSYAMYFNGNDALSLQKTTNGGASWIYVDIFGKIGDPAMVSGYGWSNQDPYDGSAPGDVEWTENHTLVRKSTVLQGVTSNPTDFIVGQQWDSLPNQTWSGLGSHTCACPVGINEIDNSVRVSIYPNPTKNVFSIKASEKINTITVFNVIGEELISQNANKNELVSNVNIESLPKGIYVVKITFDNNRTTVVKINKQ
jgi:hypothetical protein